MALKLKFKSREEMPDEVAHLYVERDGEFVLDVAQDDAAEIPGGRTNGASGGWRVPLRAEVPREKRTLRQWAEAAEENQKLIGLEGEVRRLAKEQKLDRAETNRLVERARCSWRVVNGDLLPVAQDRQTVLLAGNGRVLSLPEWVQRQTKSTSPGSSPQRGEDEEKFPMRNPFRRKTWNLTEQMKLQRRDVQLAKRLKAEAWANPD